MSKNDIGLAEEKHYEYTQIQSLYDSVRFVPGLGESGEQALIVEKECSLCGYDRMIQEISVNPDRKDGFTYQCQNPQCPKFHQGNIKGVRFTR